MKYPGVISMIILLLFGCKRTSSQYYDMEARELSKEVRYDSLFFGFYLGMSSKDFYIHCWELNTKELIRQGASNTSVYYEIPDFKYPAGMDFYPRFHRDKIMEMPLVFSYTGWSPWNKNLYANHLKVEVLTLMQKWFGENFMEIKNPKRPDSNAYVKIDGNRRVSIYNLDDSKVQVDIVDLRLLKSLEKIQEK